MSTSTLIMSKLSSSLPVLLVLLTGCADPPKVLQGQVVSYDAAATMLAVRDERTPNAVLTLSLAGAELGAEPVAGDLVRIAYREPGGQPKALRVMNLTRQAELRGEH